MRQIKIVSSDPPIEFEAPPGNLVPDLPSGLGGWEEIERQDDVSVTDWVGQEALRQDISILLDGYSENRSIERELNTILKLGRDPNGERVPPVFKVWGPGVFLPGKSWVLPSGGIDLTGGDIETIIIEGDRQRQEVILHLLEYNAPDEVKVRGKEKPRARVSGNVAVGGTYTTKAGDTLHSIAAHLFGDTKLWKVLSEKNGISDPNRKLPAGKVLKV